MQLPSLPSAEAMPPMPEQGMTPPMGGGMDPIQWYKMMYAADPRIQRLEAAQQPTRGSGWAAAGESFGKGIAQLMLQKKAEAARRELLAQMVQMQRQQVAYEEAKAQREREDAVYDKAIASKDPAVVEAAIKRYPGLAESLGPVRDSYFHTRRSEEKAKTEEMMLKELEAMPFQGTVRADVPQGTLRPDEYGPRVDPMGPSYMPTDVSRMTVGPDGQLYQVPPKTTYMQSGRDTLGLTQDPLDPTRQVNVDVLHQGAGSDYYYTGAVPTGTGTYGTLDRRTGRMVDTGVPVPPNIVRYPQYDFDANRTDYYPGYIQGNNIVPFGIPPKPQDMGFGITFEPKDLGGGIQLIGIE